MENLNEIIKIIKIMPARPKQITGKWGANIFLAVKNIQVCTN